MGRVSPRNEPNDHEGDSRNAHRLLMKFFTALGNLNVGCMGILERGRAAVIVFCCERTNCLHRCVY